MLGEGTIALIPGAGLRARNSDNDYLFRQESNFLYLTGFNEPNALLVVEGGKHSRSTLFCAPKDPEEELWTGKRHGVKGAKQEFGFNHVFSNNPKEFVEKKLLSLLRGKVVVRALLCSEDSSALIPLRPIIDRSYKENPYQSMASDIEHIIGEMRLIKSSEEVELMRRAASISAQAHREILSLVRPGMTEFALEAEITYRFRRAGGDPSHAYPPIVASGANACTLHYHENADTINDGDLVLVDAGCEWRGYASDITRTFPANGRFSNCQRAIYEIVLEAQKAAIHLARPSIPLSSLQDASTLVIVEGLMRLGIMEPADPHKAIALGLHRSFYPHGVSHWLGLDVHDVGDYKQNEFRRKERRLEPGMVLTVEPGIYIQPGALGVDPSWHGIGVRIEDDLLITRGNPEILSWDAPKEIAVIERIMSG